MELSPPVFAEVFGLFHGYLPVILLALGFLVCILALLAKLLCKRRNADAHLPLFSSEAPSSAAARPERDCTSGVEPSAAPPPAPPAVQALERCVASVAAGSCESVSGARGAGVEDWFFAIVRDERLLAGMRLVEPQLVEAPYVIALFRRAPEAQGNVAGKLITALHKAGLCTLPCTPSAGAAHIRSLLRRPDAEELRLLLPVFASGTPVRAAGDGYELGDHAVVY